MSETETDERMRRLGDVMREAAKLDPPRGECTWSMVAHASMQEGRDGGSPLKPSSALVCAVGLRAKLDAAEAREASLRERIEDLVRDNLALRLQLERRPRGVEGDMVQR